MYTIPSKYYFPVHHPRPRFKNDVENVLGYIAFSLAQIGRRDNEEFVHLLNREIRGYGANATAAQKTIDNWRTEIGALFAMYIENEFCSYPTQMSIDLANTTDLPAFFRGFVYSFQYPSGCIKPKVVGEMLEAGISFNPCFWLFNLLLKTKVDSINKCEFCHCALNDLRVTRDHEPYLETATRILKNRHVGAIYDSSSDVVRYAGDILDYCVLAELLVKGDDGYFRINMKNRDIVELFARSNRIFDKYEKISFLGSRRIHPLEPVWFSYVERNYCILKTFIQENKNTQDKRRISSYSQDINNKEKEIGPIGDVGENLVWQHECIRIKEEGRPDLVHLIKRIPTHFSVGYDIKSIESDTEYDRLIEVKTTRSQSPLLFNQIHLTPNEWRAAQSSGSKYCIYRLGVFAKGYRLFILRDPLQKLKDDLLTFVPRDGMDICFKNAAGEEVELLCAH